MDRVTAQSRVPVVGVARPLFRFMMTDFTIMRPFGPPMYYTTLPTDFISMLKEVAVNTKKKNANVGRALAGNIATQCEAVMSTEQYDAFMQEIYIHVFKALKGFDNGEDKIIGPTVTGINFNIGNGAWINFQMPGEFNPYHNHSGMLSSIIYIDVPEDIKKENDEIKIETNSPAAGKIAFVAPGSDTYLNNSCYAHQPKTGEMFIFPASLNHLVYPFKSNVERISMSFNMFNIVNIVP